MNTSLPASIESYLKEAGFSQTEMLILRKLLEENGLTVRELAGKMGKSPGLIDQAMKKLIQKKIVKKENMNSQPRYVIHSLDAVTEWVKADMKRRKEMLERRHEDFETFIATLKVDHKKPDLEHFNGLQGIKQAYDKLLASGGEMLTFTPVYYLAEEDPLRAERVELFRRRQVRKIFQRVLAPDTALSRRFQSRDMFEYRRTLLLPESELPLTFEKTIVGDTVAYIDLKGENACFIRYPDLAKAERATFEAVWGRTLNEERKGTGSLPAGLPTVIPLRTRILSCFREFILSKRSVWTILFFAILSAAFTVGLYENNRALNMERIKDTVKSIASTGAFQFDAKDIDAVSKPGDIKKAEYAKLVFTLNMIRRGNTDIQYAYVMRKTEDPKTMAFVADADSLNPSVRKDINHDGVINEKDSFIYPGDAYEIMEYPHIANAFRQPIADPAPTTDYWGTFISGYAPIYNDKREAAAILGIDMFASKLDEISAQSFTPVYYFIGFFLLFMLMRFWLENRALMAECVEEMKKCKKKCFAWIITSIIVLISIGYVFHLYTEHVRLEEIGKRLMSIAITAADDFDPNDLNQFHFARDMRSDAYQRVFTKLNEIRNRNPDVTVAYIVRPTENPMMFQFVANSDANYNIPWHSNAWIDDLKSNEDSDESPWPGYMYEDFFPVFRLGLKKPAYGFTPFDKWGSSATGMAPIFQSGSLVGILSIDIVFDNENNFNH